jgi:hypothetical protein
MREAKYVRYVVASSPDQAIKNALGRWGSFLSRDEAEEYMEEHPGGFPRNGGFAVFEVTLMAMETVDDPIDMTTEFIDGEGL